MGYYVLTNLFSIPFFFDKLGFSVLKINLPHALKLLYLCTEERWDYTSLNMVDTVSAPVLKAKYRLI